MLKDQQRLIIHLMLSSLLLSLYNLFTINNLKHLHVQKLLIDFIYLIYFCFPNRHNYKLLNLNCQQDFYNFFIFFIIISNSLKLGLFGGFILMFYPYQGVHKQYILVYNVAFDGES